MAVHRVVLPLALAAAAAVGTAAWAPGARAAAPWVDRDLTLPASTWAFDVGMGIGHSPAPSPGEDTSVGVNLEAAVGVTERVELGVRTGLRFGDPIERAIEPDDYGRLFDRQYFDGGASVLANPELRARVLLVRGPVLELGVEGRFVLPFEEGTVAGLEPGLPIQLHLGDRVRMDTGVWLPVVFGSTAGRATVGISAPLDVWIQVSPRVWLGPMTGLRSYDVGSGPDRPASQTFLSMGFGLGVQISRAVDFKTMLLFPALSQDSSVFGVGAGVQVRIE